MVVREDTNHGGAYTELSLRLPLFLISLRQKKTLILTTDN